MAKKPSLAFALQLCAVASACSSSSTTTPPTNAQACSDYANALCKLYSQCSDGYYVTQQYGDLTTCVSRYQSNCVARLALPSAQSATTTDACAQALPTESCENLYGNNLSAICRPPDGGVATASVCTVSAQCQTAFCAIPKNELCGNCAEPPVAGDDCSVFPCGPGLICLRATMTCGIQASDGGGCLGEGDCQYGFACLDHFGDGGLCVPTAAVGAMCDLERLSGEVCPSRLGLYCMRAADGGICATFSQVDAGEPCGNVAGVGTTCLQSGSCQKSEPDAGEGICLASASDGTACDSDGGPQCLPLSRCVPSSDAGTPGTCQQPGAVACQ